MPSGERRPTAAELGDDVTIGIAAILPRSGQIVAVSDQRIRNHRDASTKFPTRICSPVWRAPRLRPPA